MIKNIVIGIAIVAASLVVIVCSMFYRSDLSKEQLGMYINEHSQFVTLSSGANVHYRDEGNSTGKTIVMVHGGFGSLHNWSGWVAALSNEYRIISIDLLGHGLTGAYPINIYTREAQRDMIHELLSTLDVKHYIIAGNSFGGGIALEVALKYAENVDGLILIASEGVPNTPDGYDTSMFTDVEAVSPNDPKFTQLSFIETIGAKFISTTAVKFILESLFYNDNYLTDDYIDYFARILRYEGNRESQLLMFSQGLSAVSQHPDDLKPRLSEINCPTLVMAGASDTVVPMFVNDTFNELIKHSELVVIENAGHMPMIEKSIETAQLVQSFISKYISP